MNNGLRRKEEKLHDQENKEEYDTQRRMRKTGGEEQRERERERERGRKRGEGGIKTKEEGTKTFSSRG